VLEYSLIPDSGGAGRMRGGMGTRRIMRVEPGAEVTCNAMLDRTKPGFGAWALEGGGRGGPAAIKVKRSGESEFSTFSQAYGTASDSKFTNILLKPGDEVLIESPGGGGYGDPHERDRARVQADLREGFVSAESARELYGFETA
jgi:N-methylhydantoinase B/oxoprolinase/acetone carboxylase alpha subunit